MITQVSDLYRPAYAKFVVDRPRRFVFIGTTNEATYLPDSTGNRRFLPVPCQRIDTAALKIERDQIFAEANTLLRRLTAGALRSGHARKGHALPQDLAARLVLPQKLWSEAAEIAEMRRVVDPVEEALPGVVEYLEASTVHRLPDGRKFVSSADLLATLRTQTCSHVRNNGLAGWMKDLGWTPVKHRLSRNYQIRGYAK